MNRLPDWNLDPPEDDIEMSRKKRRYYREEPDDEDETPFDIDFIYDPLRREPDESLS